MKRKSLSLFLAVLPCVVVLGVATEVDAADVSIIGTRSGSNSDCTSEFGAGGQCFTHNGKITADLVNDEIRVVNPVVGYLNDTITLTNAAGTHNVVFCKAGTTVNGWNCGDPISTVGGPDPGCCQDSSSAGAPAKIGYSFDNPNPPYSTTLTSTGEFYFWCAIGNHRVSGQYGKLVVNAAPPPTSSTTTSTTVSVTSSPTTTVAPTASSVPQGSPSTVSQPGARTLPNGAIVRPVVSARRGRTVTAKSLLSLRADATVTRLVSRTSSVCRVSGTSLRMLKTGTCRYSASVKRRGVTSTVSLTVKVT